MACCVRVVISSLMAPGVVGLLGNLVENGVQDEQGDAEVHGADGLADVYFVADEDDHFAAGDDLDDERVAFLLEHAEVELDELFPGAAEAVQDHHDDALDNPVFDFGELARLRQGHSLAAEDPVHDGGRPWRGSFR